MHTPSPKIVRQNIRLAVVLILLAMAALWLRPLRIRGAEPGAVPALPERVQLAQVPEELGGSEKFVPGGARFYDGATLELRPEVTVIGEQVKLRSVCRWADADKPAFEPIADLVLLRLPRTSPFRTLTVRELRDVLHDAGVNLAVLRLAGATSCTVSRSDVKFDERTALDQWIAAREAGAAKPALIETPGKLDSPLMRDPGSTPFPGATRVDPDAKNAPPTPPETPGAPDSKITKRTQPAPAAPPQTASPAGDAPLEPKAVKTLRDLLTTEAAERLNLPATDLQFHFNPADDRVLNLSEPIFKFGLLPPRHKQLGENTWEVSIVADAGTQRATVTANVRAWQKQVVLNKPFAYRQTLAAADLTERRTLVDRMSEDPLVTRDQAVGQMASRDLKPGTILTARLVEAPVLVKPGQLVTVTLTQGAIQAKSVAKATEQGALGQTVRVRNEATGNLFDVVVTGAQTAKLPSGPAADIAIR